MKTIKRLLSAAMAGILALALVLPALPPAQAAGQSSFVDVRDDATAVNADILRLMGVVSGTGGDRFNPDGVLTRAQFCTMVVNFMQRSSEVAIHSTRTIFTDVPAGHWARGYVNLAASLTVKDGESEVPLVSGVGDGRFLPDDPISQAQAVTILIRMLGYTSAQAGAVWPQSYMDLAGSIALTDGMPADYNAPLTRAQAAQLFVNALNCETAEGAVYYTTLGEAKADTVLLAVNVAADTGDALGAVRTSSGTYLPRADNVSPTALQGRRGILVLSDRKEIVTFVPDNSQSVTITLSEDAGPNYIKAGGQQYTIAGDTMVYTSGQEAGESYLDSYSSLYAGSQVTLFTQRGKVVAVYTASTSTPIDADAVVVMGSPTAATFHQLTGGATNFNIVKNRQTIRLSDIQPYDVVTYDEMSNTLIVSDLRITCVYQNAEPNVNTPKTITFLGNELEVLESAWDSAQNFTLGESVSLLLTADGKVAGMAAPGADTRSTAVGMVEGGSASVFLPNGGTWKLSGTVSNADNVDGQLVIFSASRSSLTTSRIADGNRAPGPFDVDEMTLGDRTVLGAVKVYEKVTTSALAPVTLSDLTGLGQIPADQISGYHANSSGMVDYIVLDNVTGNAYEYGMMVGKTVTTPGTPIVDDNGDPVEDENGKPTYTDPTTRTTWSLVRGIGGGITFAEIAGYAGRSGDIVGIVSYKNREGKDMIRTILELTERTVSAKDFFQSEGSWYVTANGRNYKVASDVECYGGMGSGRVDPNSWFTQEDTGDRLSAMRAFSDTLTVYIDPVGNQVRVITAG